MPISHELSQPFARKLRIAIAGAGLIGTAHQRRMTHSPTLQETCECVGFADPAPAAQAAAAAANSPWFADLSALLDAQQPDGVVLATPNHLHLEGALLCLERGIPVLVEKPIAHTLDAAQALVAVQQRTQVPVLVGHHRRHSAYLKAAQQAVQRGDLGRLVAVNCTTLFYKPSAYFAAATWRTRAGGGPILINLVHDIDCMRALAGDVVQVQALASHAVRGLAVEDTAAIALRFASGALGTFIVSDTAAAPYSWEQTTGENPDFAHDPNASCYLLAGDRGSLSLPTLRLHHSPAGQAEPSWNTALQVTELNAEHTDPLVAQMVHFCSVIRGETAPLVSALEGAKTLQVVECIARAAQTGQLQNITPL